MTAIASRRLVKGPVPSSNRTIAWVSAIVLLVSLLTSERVWAQFFDIVGAEDDHYGQSDPYSPKSRREIDLLVKLTDAPVIVPDISPTEAVERNAAIPFTHSPVAAARPFRVFAANEISSMTALKCMTQAVYYEAGFEPLEGRKAVAQVVLNRVMHPAFPNSVCGVVYQGVNKRVCQFSFTCDGSLNRRPNPDAWRESEAVALAALNGHVATSVGYATHYHANYVSPYWAPKLVKLAKIGAHIFYRWPGGWGMPKAFSGRYAGAEAIPAILPRSQVNGRSDGDKRQGQASSLARLPDGHGPDRHAENDVGGRLDMTAGWSLAVPEPDDTASAARTIARQQAGEFEFGGTGGGS
ncbi:MAG: cell wall hydrolase [Sphingorhabdus sp.]